MARPRKWRRVCCVPESNLFGPLDTPLMDDNPIIMTVDEYETIRLIDLEGLMQEECAEQMDVARTTVQRIYIEARQKIADALINGKMLKIEGGDYQLYNDNETAYRCGRCRHQGLGRGRGAGQGRGLGLGPGCRNNKINEEE